MIDRLKATVYRAFPEFAAASEAYQATREIRKAVPRLTPFGFTFLGPEAMQDGTFEAEETGLLRDILREADILVDVGANIGFYSCLARSMGRRVIAVEPLSRNLQFLYANLLVNGWDDVEVFPVGLSSHPGQAVLHGSGTSASLVENWAGPSNKRRVIPLSTLDTLLGERFAGKKLVVKIDVEGVEYDVLQGASHTLDRRPSPAWFIETGLGGWSPEGYSSRFGDIFEVFWASGFEARVAMKGGKIVSRDDVTSWLRRQDTDGFSNFIFSKTES